MSKLKEFFLIDDPKNPNSEFGSRVASRVKSTLSLKGSSFYEDLGAKKIVERVQQSRLITPRFKKSEVFLNLGRYPKTYIYKNEVVRYEVVTKVFMLLGCVILTGGFTYIFLGFVLAIFRSVIDSNFLGALYGTGLGFGVLVVSIGAWNRSIFLLLSLRKGLDE